MQMDKVSIDIFAETNPAFCTLIIYKFCQGYYAETNQGVPFPLLILPLPIILSGDLLESFEHTRTNTGFFKWINNNPEIILDISTRINDTSEFLNPAIKFGIYKKIFSIDDLGLLIPNAENVNNKKTPDLEHLFKYSERFGKWIGQVNSIKTIYNHLGIAI